MTLRHAFDPRLPADQASGLRRLFGPVRRCLLPVAANPFVPAGQALLETLSAALAALGRQVLVVDAATSAPPPPETTLFGLAAGVEQLHEQVHYLPARGLPLAYVDTRGSAATFVDAVFDAAPRADAVLLHADVTDLARMLGGRAVRPLLLASDQPESVKQAYACCKLLAQRCGLMTFDLVMAAPSINRRMSLIADRVATCADAFIGAVVHDWAVVDPIFDPLAAHDPALVRLLGAQLASLDEPRPLPTLQRAGVTSAARSGAAHTPL